jgi:type II secretory pathway component PulM
MMRLISTWFDTRTAREQMLLKALLFVVLVIALPFWAWRAAADYRTEGARDLDAAMALRSDAAKLAGILATPNAAPPVDFDGTARGLASAMAAQTGLSLLRLSPDGPTGVQAVFEPASAIAVYKWIDGVERAGMAVTSVVMVRAGEGDLVSAQARLAPRPT